MPEGDTQAGQLAAQDVRAAYRGEMRALLASRVPAIIALFVIFVGIGSIVEWMHEPRRLGLLVAIWLGHAVTLGTMYLLARRFPDHADVLVIVGANLVSLLVCAYYPLAGGKGELCALTLILFLTGFVLLNPWGAHGQLLGGLGVLLGYPAALLAGTATAAPPLYSLVAIAAAVVLTTLGAELIDRHRFDAYRQAAELRRTSEARAEFLATLSHEVRTPLNGIVGYCDMLLDGAFGPLSGSQSNSVRRVRQLSLQAIDLVQGMLDLTRLEAGVVSVNIESFRLSELIDRLSASIPSGWCKENVELRWNVRGGQTVVRSDRLKLELIVRNLIHNAFKYTEEGTITVSAKSRFDTGHLQITVEDTGSGIAPADQAKIFGMFEQTDRPARDGGVGLGLYIVKRFTHALGGEISLRSELGSGTEFTISIPLVPRA